MNVKNTNLTNKHRPELLTEMVSALMSGSSASFAQKARAYLGGDQDTITETQIAVTANRIGQPRWWKQFVGEQLTEEAAVDAKRALSESLGSPSVSSESPAAVKNLAERLKLSFEKGSRAVSALGALVGSANDFGYLSEAGESHFHLGRLCADLEEDLALAQDLCEAVVRATDPRVVKDTYRFLVEQAQGLFAGVEVVAVLADRFYEVTGAATGQ